MMGSEKQETERRDALTKAVAGLERVLPTLRQDPRAYAALAAAIAFVEVVLQRHLPDATRPEGA
jgi:hypothetical protein